MAAEKATGLKIEEIVIGVDEMSLIDYALQLAEALEEAPRNEAMVVEVTDAAAIEIADRLRTKALDMQRGEVEIVTSRAEARKYLKRLLDEEGAITTGSIRSKHRRHGNDQSMS